MKCPQFKGCPSDQECLPGIPNANPKGPLSGSPTHPGRVTDRRDVLDTTVDSHPPPWVSERHPAEHSVYSLT